MVIGEVIGTVVATRKTENVQGLPLRIVRRLTTEASPTESYVVAVDVVGASDGELVLLTSGSAARNTHLTDARPVDAIVIAIVDTWQIDGVVKYVSIEGTRLLQTPV
jgi:microcompartment protein CcmK/EutM